MSTKKLPAFALILRQLRDTKGLTQQALADRASLPVDTIRGLEYGRRLPSWETVDKLADGLNVSVEAFRQLAKHGLLTHLKEKIAHKERKAAEWKEYAEGARRTDLGNAMANKANRRYHEEMANHFQRQVEELKAELKKVQAIP